MNDRQIIENFGYIVDKTLGSGAQGTVYEAHKNGYPAQKYAIKTIIIGDDDNNQRIQNEIKNLTLLSSLKGMGCSRFIVCYRGFQTVGQTIFLLMDIAQGKNLEYIINSKISLNRDTFRFIILHLLEGLVYIHHNGVAHRDIKPDNIIYDKSVHESSLKYIDFGLSCSSSQRCTGNGAPSYFPPEGNNLSEYDISGWKKADIWSLGLTLWSMQNLKYPYQDLTMADIALGKYYQIISSSGDPAVDEIINSMINLNPNERLSASEANEMAINNFSDKCSIDDLDISKEELIDILEQLNPNIGQISFEEMCEEVTKQFRMGMISLNFEDEDADISWDDVM